MKYRGLIRVSEMVFISVFFSFISCTSSRTAMVPDAPFIQTDTWTGQSENYEVNVDYIGLRDRNHEFKVFIRNESKDSVVVNPGLFKYDYGSGKNDTHKNTVSSIDPEERMRLLEVLADSLKNKKNPHSLEDKTVKEIVAEGLVEGAVGALFGKDIEEFESQREKDEYEWQQEHVARLQDLYKELDFWNESALRHSTIPPKKAVNGSVLFPALSDTKKIQLEIPIQNTVYHFIFEKSLK